MAKRLTIYDFIERANMVHNFKYNYDKSLYENSKVKLIITCEEHGDFLQIPNDHLRGRGCPGCGGRKKFTKEEFIKRANMVHDFKYNYDKVNYINIKTKVIIQCKEHGDFLQTPNNHLSGCGCPKCNESKGEREISNILDENKINYLREFSFDNLKSRKKLRFDFVIFDNKNNLKYLIEYNGVQHYEYRNVFHKSEKQFEKYKHRDKLKMEYCIKNNIKLYIIKYDENIYEKMKFIIKNKI